MLPLPPAQRYVVKALPQNKTFRNKFALFGEGRLQCNLKTWGIL
jgi:hypothetical protein